MRNAYRYMFNMMLAIIASFVLFIAADSLIAWYRWPPSYVVDIRSYLQWQPKVNGFVPVDVEGQHFFICYGGGLGIMPSGPSAHVFDESGKKVDWSRDIGDDSVFIQRWNAQKIRDSSDVISVADMLERLGRSATQPATNTQ